MSANVFLIQFLLLLLLNDKCVLDCNRKDNGQRDFDFDISIQVFGPLKLKCSAIV